MTPLHSETVVGVVGTVVGVVETTVVLLVAVMGDTGEDDDDEEEEDAGFVVAVVAVVEEEEEEGILVEVEVAVDGKGGVEGSVVVGCSGVGVVQFFMKK